MSVYRVDIDETICMYPLDREYDQAAPIEENIAKINKLYDEGHTIIMWTARGATTGINWWYLTTKQLKSWGVKYHELKLDKPQFDYIVDDKARKVEEL